MDRTVCGHNNRPSECQQCLDEIPAFLRRKVGAGDGNTFVVDEQYRVTQIADLTAKLAESEIERDSLSRGILGMGAANDELRAEVARHKEIAAEFAQTNVEINGKWFAEKRARESAEAEVARLEKESRLHAGEIGNLAFAIQEHKEAREAAEARLREAVPQLQEALDYCHEQTACRAAVKVAIVIRTMQAALAKSADTLASIDRPAAT